MKRPRKHPLGLRRAGRKQRKTFSLSPRAISALEEFRRQRRTESLTAAVECLLEEWRLEQEFSRMSASVSSFYDALTDEEVREAGAWGEFAESQASAEEQQ